MEFTDYDDKTCTGSGPGKIIRAILWMAVGALVTVGILYMIGAPLFPGEGEQGVDEVQLWTCGMHPEVLQEEPGVCPICHMDLTPLRTGDTDSEGVAHEGHNHTAEELWTCPMHPDFLESEPGSCPICGMDLVPVEGGPADDEGGEREILFYRNPMDPGITSPVPRKDDMGMAYVPVYSDEAWSPVHQGTPVTIDPVVVQNMNVRTEPVQRRDLDRAIRTVGHLDYDQERMVSVTTRYEGFIEKVFVASVGQPVAEGDPLFEVYSPELVQTQQELLSAIQYAGRMADSDPETRRRAESLVASARLRLSYWDVTDDQVAEIEASGKVMRTLTVVSPIDGVIMRRMHGLEGMAIRPGMEALHVADLSTLWLTVEVYEGQLAWLDKDSTADISFDYFPGEHFTGRVRYVEPEVSPSTRTVKFTLEVPNRAGRLKVGMYATVRFEPVVAHDAVVVPAQAVIRSGERDVVVVALGQGRFAPREVTLGAQSKGLIQVLDGLDGGEEIVTSAQFLIDSESNLRAAVQKMIAARQRGDHPEERSDEGSPAASRGHRH